MTQNPITLLLSCLAVLIQGLLSGAVLATPVRAAKPEKPASYAIIIANQKYLHTANVSYARRDAAAVHSMFRDVLKIPESHIYRYDNQTKTDLEYLFGRKGGTGQLHRLVQNPDARLYIYYVGHGSREYINRSKPMKPYLLGMDTRPSRLRHTAYSLELLLTQLKKFQKSILRKGSVMLFLESCFSGETHAGRLGKNRKRKKRRTPAFRIPDTSSRFVVVSAAANDQVSIWDTEYRQGIFTDALVNGFYGEADLARFGGNGDGKVSLGELENFLKFYVAHRVRVIRPAFRQVPKITGGQDTALLVDLAVPATEKPLRIEIVRRRQQEKIEAGQILAGGQEKQVRDYLRRCFYCAKADRMRRFMRERRKKQAYCRVEKKFVRELADSGTSKEIRTFQHFCKCCPDGRKLEQKLASLKQVDVKRGKDQLLWNRAQQASTVQGFIAYRKACTLCENRAQASTQIKDICQSHRDRASLVWRKDPTVRNRRLYLAQCREFPAICKRCRYTRKASAQLKSLLRNRKQSRLKRDFDTAIALNSREVFQTFLRKYPAGKMSRIIRKRYNRLRNAP